MNNKKRNKLAAWMLSGMMAMTALSVHTHAEEPINVWQIGEETYATLQEAVNNANNGATIQLLKDASGNGVKVSGDKNITIDFNGNTYDITGDLVGSTGTQTQAFQLLKGSKVAMKNGTITSEKAKMLVQNYGNLTLNSMNLDGSKLNLTKPYTLSNNCGNVVIQDSTITAKTGGFAFDVFYWPTKGYGEGVSVTVSGHSQINGNIEYASDGSVDGLADVTTKANLHIQSGTFDGEIKTTNVTTPDEAGITISGGSFTNKPNENYFADGFEVTEDENGDFVVENKEDKTKALADLKKTIEKAETLLKNEAAYTAESVANVKTALNAANAIDESATLAQITKANQVLTAEMDALETKLNTSELTKMIQSAKQEAARADVYTTESIAALQKVIASAEATIRQATAQDEINAKTAELKEAIAALMKIDSNPNTVLTDPKTNVTVQIFDGSVDPDTKLVVKSVTAETVDENYAWGFKRIEGNYVAYDINLMKDDVVVRPDGTLRVFMDIPEGFDENNLALYHIGLGSVSGWVFSVENGRVSFSTNSFGVYVLEDKGSNKDSDKNDTNIENKEDTIIKDTATNHFNGFGAMSIVVLMGFGAYWKLAKKRHDNEA